MGLEVKGTKELMADITEMADMLGSSGGNGAGAVRYILQKAVEPIYMQMLTNASSDPQIISGNLYRSIKIGHVTKHQKRNGGGYSVEVGVHKGEGAGYANAVEFGHGGPHPAPAHPFVRPAFDARCDEAYARVKEELNIALKARGLK